MKYAEFKNRAESLLVPLARRTPLPPLLITVFSIIAMCVAGYAVWKFQFLVAAAFVLISGFLDAYDGAVAKTHAGGTAFGSVFDKTADRINDAVILAAIILRGLVPLDLGLIALLTVVLASYVSACMDAVTKKQIGEKISLRPLRFAILILGLVIPGALYHTVVILAALGCYSFLSRLRMAWLVLR